MTTPIRSNPSVGGIDFSRKRARYDAEEEKEVENGNDSQKNIRVDDTIALCIQIENGLREGYNPHQLAEKILQINPEIVYKIANYRKRDLICDLETNFSEARYENDLQDKIRRTTLILYSMCLINSKYGKTVESLEQELPKLLPLSVKAYALNLIREGQTLHLAKSGDTLDEIQDQLKQLNNSISQLNDHLNLYYYIDSEIREKVENIYTYAKNLGRDRFPVCKRHFPQLCQNLSIPLSEKDQMSQLRNQLLQQLRQLQLKLASFFPKKETSQRSRFLGYYSVPLWACGSTLLESGLKAIFEERLYVPDLFVSSVNNVAKEAEFQAFTFSNLLYKEIPQLPPRFISLVWDQYADQDIADLMKQIVSKMSDLEFETFEKSIQTNNTAEALEHLKTFLKTQFEEPITLISLRTWVEKMK